LLTFAPTSRLMIHTALQQSSALSPSVDVNHRTIPTLVQPSHSSGCLRLGNFECGGANFTSQTPGQQLGLPVYGHMHCVFAFYSEAGAFEKLHVLRCGPSTGNQVAGKVDQLRDLKPRQNITAKLSILLARPERCCCTIVFNAASSTFIN